MLYFFFNFIYLLYLFKITFITHYCFASIRLQFNMHIYFIFTIFMVVIAVNIVSNLRDNVNMYLVSPVLGLPVF